MIRKYADRAETAVHSPACFDTNVKSPKICPVQQDGLCLTMMTGSSDRHGFNGKSSEICTAWQNGLCSAITADSSAYCSHAGHQPEAESASIRTALLHPAQPKKSDHLPYGIMKEARA